MQASQPSLRVLVVDSEPLLRQSLKRLLVASDPSLEVITADGPEAARRILDQGPIDVLMADDWHSATVRCHV